MTCSSSRSGICPWPIRMLASGTSFCSSEAMRPMSSTRLWMKYTWPPRFISRRQASRITTSLHSDTKVLTASRSAGGVVIKDISRMPPKAMFRVLGIGVAVRVSTSISLRRDLIDSLCRTPKRCSSSMITRPTSLKSFVCPSNRWVPITTSTLPDCRPLTISLTCFAD